MRKMILLFALVALAIAPSFAQQKKLSISQFYPVDAGHSYLEFSIKYMGYAKVKGRFGEFSGMFRYDDSDLSNTSVTLVIKVESIDSDLEFRDNDLKSENWFDAKKFPMITFKSKNITKRKDGFDVTGDLTMKDVTKEVLLHLDPPSGVLKDVRGDAQVIFTGSTSLNRNDFGVEGKRWSAVKEGITAVDSEVKIEFSILGKQLKAANFSNWVRDDQKPAGKLYKLIKEQGVAAGVSEFQKMKTENAVDENALSAAGRMLLLEGKTEDAMKVFETNRDAFSTSSSAQFNLGEAYATKGDWNKAKASFDAALKLDPMNSKALEVLRHIQ
jgi:polyisoprenoid-binding protein YceI